MHSRKQTKQSFIQRHLVANLCIKSNFSHSPCSDDPDPDAKTEPGSPKNEMEVQTPENSENKSSEDTSEENKKKSKITKLFKCKTCKSYFKLEKHLHRHIQDNHMFG